MSKFILSGLFLANSELTSLVSSSSYCEYEKKFTGGLARTGLTGLHVSLLRGRPRPFFGSVSATGVCVFRGRPRLLFCSESAEGAGHFWGRLLGLFVEESRVEKYTLNQAFLWIHFVGFIAVCLQISY